MQITAANAGVYSGATVLRFYVSNMHDQLVTHQRNRKTGMLKIASYDPFKLKGFFYKKRSHGTFSQAAYYDRNLLKISIKLHVTS